MNDSSLSNPHSPPPLVPASVVWPFILLTSLFAWWGLANNMTDTLLAAFKRIMSMSDSKTALIQVVCYFGGYGLAAIPAAIFIKKFSYKSGVLLGLGLYSIGAILFFPAQLTYQVAPTFTYFFFLAAIWILFSGLSVLETAANPYIIAMGPEETGTRRLNFAQSFNPMGSIIGVIVSQMFILSGLNRATEAERAALPPAELEAMQYGELSAVTTTYVVVGLVLVATWILIAITKMPQAQDTDNRVDFIPTLGRLLRNGHYVWGVVAQFFYVGAQIGVWSFTIRYVMKELRLEEMEFPAGMTSESIAAGYYVAALVLFVASRFICTALMRFITPGHLLALLACVAMVCTVVVMFPPPLGVWELPVPFTDSIVLLSSGVVGLIGISGCMSLMFPTIFGLGCRGLGEDAKIASSGMIMAILGAAVVTQLQGAISDWTGSINLSYVVPLVCFVFIFYYGAVACRQDLSAREAATQ